MTSFIHVTTTVDSQDKAEEITQQILEHRLAACVQIMGPITSRYWWQGKIETATEWVCTAKTREELYPQLHATIRSIHPYEVPEILASSIKAGDEDYLEWLAGETEQPSD